jgi:hypothetical protein
MSRTLRLVLAAGALAALPVASATLHAQASPAATKRPTAQRPATKSAAKDSLAFPRQFVAWVFASEGDSAYAHAGPELRENMKSPEGVRTMASRIKTRFGESQGTDAEVQFDEGAQKVYIAVMRFPQAPEPAAWTVVYTPGTKMVERAGFSPLSSVKTRYPQAKLP